MEHLKRNQSKPAHEKSPQKDGVSSTKARKAISVTFIVTVPVSEQTPPPVVYLTGSFNKFSPNLPNWDPRGLAMKKLDDRRWTITLMGQPQTEVEYKYTQGSWQRVEVDAHGRDVPNRQVTLDSSSADIQTIEDHVQGWRNS